MFAWILGQKFIQDIFSVCEHTTWHEHSTSTIKDINHEQFLKKYLNWETSLTHDNEHAFRIEG